MRTRDIQWSLGAAVLVCALTSCGTASSEPTSTHAVDESRATSQQSPSTTTPEPATLTPEPPSESPTITPEPAPPPAEPPRKVSPHGPLMQQDPNVPVAPDLRRLAEEFVTYAVGDAESFPHWESVSFALGGQTTASIDDIDAALANRDIWQTCRPDGEGYAAATCPVNILGSLQSAVINDAVIVYSGEYAEVTCAPTRAGPSPAGRWVVLSPSEEMRTCASDFALLLVADDQGRLRSVDLTLSEP